MHNVVRDDAWLVEKANELLSKGAYSRFSLAKILHTSKPRLDKLAAEGLIKNYPKPMNHSQAAKWNRIVTGDKWGGKFKLRGSPSFG